MDDALLFQISCGLLSSTTPFSFKTPNTSIAWAGGFGAPGRSAPKGRPSSERCDTDAMKKRPCHSAETDVAVFYSDVAGFSRRCGCFRNKRHAVLKCPARHETNPCVDACVTGTCLFNVLFSCVCSGQRCLQTPKVLPSLWELQRHGQVSTCCIDLAAVKHITCHHPKQKYHRRRPRMSMLFKRF